jgi:2-polyprenyl-3-methyl-5-hydroxy-6-metoxy-1,4-benzoquinol methylase
MKRKMIAEKWDEVYSLDELLALGGKDLKSKVLKEKDEAIAFIYNTRHLLLDRLKIPRGEWRLLDIGCGSLVSLVIPAAERGLNVTGIDISPVAV